MCGAKRLNLAEAAYRKALRVLTRKTVPLRWARAQVNLGNVLSSKERLKEAARCYGSALEVLKAEDPMYSAVANALVRVEERLGVETECAQTGGKPQIRRLS